MISTNNKHNLSKQINNKTSSKNNYNNPSKIHTKLIVFLIISILFAFIFWYYFIKTKIEKVTYTLITPFPKVPYEEEVKKKTLEYKNIVFAGLPKWLGFGNPPLVLFNSAYVSGYCEDKKNPIWVAYRLYSIDHKKRLPRPKDFFIDYRTSSKVNPKEFSRTGYDRGHLAPSYIIGLRFGRNAQLETFLMSNISPQRPELNRKIWTKLENLEDIYANKFKEVWVFTGPIFDDYKEFLPTGIEIPDAFYKIFIDVDEQTSNVRFLSFIVPQNVKGNENIIQFLTSIDEIENKTKLDFFAPFSDIIENEFEAFVAKELW